MVIIHSSENTVFHVSHIKGITVVADEEQVVWVWIGEVGGRTREEQAAGLYGTDFTAVFLARVEVRD